MAPAVLNTISEQPCSGGMRPAEEFQLITGNYLGLLALVSHAEAPALHNVKVEVFDNVSEGATQRGGGAYDMPARGLTYGAVIGPACRILCSSLVLISRSCWASVQQQQHRALTQSSAKPPCMLYSLRIRARCIMVSIPGMNVSM